MIKRTIKILLVVGFIIIIVGILLINFYYLDFNYSRKKEQFTEFWSVARAGGGKNIQSEDQMYEKYLPLSSNKSDLREFNMVFNISTHNETLFWICPQLVAGLFGGAYVTLVGSEWNCNDGGHTNKEMRYIYDNFGKYTPRSLTIVSMNDFFVISSNNTHYNYPIGNVTNVQYTEKTPYDGVANMHTMILRYKPEKGFIFRPDNGSDFYPDFNSDNS
ncbi:MAG: hypothetical protein P8Y70_10500 [Candidatus Lokiarchaeota archaeon]